MRTLLLTAAALLLGTAEAQAHWPITYVGSSAIHRCEGPVHQVTLMQTPAEAEKARADEYDDRTSECAIETGTFLQEPLPKAHFEYLAEAITAERLSDDLPQRMEQWHKLLRDMSF